MGNTMRAYHVIFLGFLAASFAEDLVQEEADQEERLEKSLLNSFPFNAGDHGEHHGEHHAAHEEDETPNLRQLVALSRSVPQARYGVVEPPSEEKKCVQKVMMVEEVIWD